MKKTIISILLFAGLVSAARADFALDKWKYYKEVGGTAEGLQKVVMDDEVFANSAGNLADLRLTDAGGREVPYELVATEGKNQTSLYNPSMINNSVVPGKFSSVILDLGGRGMISNSAAIRTGSENFQRNVTIYGSDDQQSWNILKAGAYIYDYTDKSARFKAQNTKVDFPDSVFRFLKVEISDPDSKPVTIDSVAVTQTISIAASQFKRNPKYEIIARPERKSTEVIVDYGSAGIPTSRINLSARDENFNRSLSVFSSDDMNSADWELVGQGYIFRYDTPKFRGENSAVDVRETFGRYLKIVIHNQDNPALRLSGVETFSFYRELDFLAKPGEKYRLFYGNNKAAVPQYDLEKYIQYLNLSEIKTASLGPQTANPGFVPETPAAKPLTERSPYVMPAALAVVSLGLLFLVYKFLKAKPV